MTRHSALAPTPGNTPIGPLSAKPLVSIIVPSFNQGRFIRRTLESILSQDYRPIEIIVIDGASTDGSVDILREFSTAPELKWVSEPDRGVVEAVNKGFARARGEIGAIQSSDDFYMPGAIAAGVEALQSNPALAFAFGDIAKVDAEGRELSRTQLAPYSLEGVLSMETWIPQPSTFFRMELAKSLGGWRKEVPFAADTDLWLRMAMKAPAFKIDRLMAERSMHDAQRDKNGARIVLDYAHAIDTLPGLSMAPSRIRRAARAGKLLKANRYDPGSGSLVRMRRLWGAIFLYPRLLRRLPVGALVPGWFLAQSKLTGLFRRLRAARVFRANDSESRAVLSISRRIHDLPGVLLKDVPRYQRALSRSGAGYLSDQAGWISLCNRGELLLTRPDVPGAECSWWEGSTLHAPQVLPYLGQKVMDAALREWPIEFQFSPPKISDTPTISFIFTHSGLDRLSQLILVIASIRAQRGVSCECVVVDQSTQPVRDQLPADARYVHLNSTGLKVGWRKSWGYNVGARLARADILIFQDGDVCVPVAYAAEVSKAFERIDIGATSLQRFLFYLDGAASTRVADSREILRNVPPQMIRQNWKGGTIAVRKEAFFSIGGFDEGFVDWGGEDVEFYDRCAEIGHCRSGYLPFIHLWHPPQSQRRSVDNQNINDILPAQLNIPRSKRIAELSGRDFGNAVGPTPREQYA